VIAKNRSELLANKAQLKIHDHPLLRDDQACFASSSYAVELAKKHGSQLHVLHITTEKELSLFESGSIEGKQITAEACVHHLWFSDEDYAEYGNLIKCNPAIKKASDREALIQALDSGKIDIIATDHAPHTLEEKQVDYEQAPAGLPLVQHALLTLLDHVYHGRMTIEQVALKVAHNPAIRYAIEERGFIREGYYADLVLVDCDSTTDVTNENSLYHCQWSPFNGHQFHSAIERTWVNGQQVFERGEHPSCPQPAMRLTFSR
jgi:dihydroorotase